MAGRVGALLVHYSTDYVFDGSGTQPYREDDTPNPQGVYGRSKLDGERAIENAGGDYLILRTAWVYGARGQNFLRTLRRLARNAKSCGSSPTSAARPPGRATSPRPRRKSSPSWATTTPPGIRRQASTT